MTAGLITYLVTYSFIELACFKPLT